MKQVDMVNWPNVKELWVRPRFAAMYKAQYQIMLPIYRRWFNGKDDGYVEVVDRQNGEVRKLTAKPFPDSEKVHLSFIEDSRLLKHEKPLVQFIRQGERWDYEIHDAVGGSAKERYEEMEKGIGTYTITSISDHGRATWYLLLEDETEPTEIAVVPEFDVAAALVDQRKKEWRESYRREKQDEFRKDLIAAYGGRCAMTGCKVLDALQAAHIIRWRGLYSNKIPNGLLLRSDIHVMYDKNLIVIDPETFVISVAPELMEEYANLHGQKLRLPKKKEHWPSREALRQHMMKS